MSINEASEKDWDALRADRHYDNRPMPQPDGYDSVEKPMHYDGQVECIEYIRDRLGHEGFIAYCWGSVIKYQHRWKEKGGIESLRKARWFLNRLIQEEATGRFDG
jgi:hypothetical protein